MTYGNYVGCMTGTSVDGLDLALIEVSPLNLSKGVKEAIVLLNAQTRPLPEALRNSLLACGQPDQSNVDLLGECDTQLGHFIGTSIADWLKSLGIPAGTIQAIGSHGQTVRHRPPKTLGTAFTLQIGDPNHIAEITGIDTVADFRRRDMAAGGQGAPLAPAFHKVLFGDTAMATCVVNIGGISNISPLNERGGGFDTGPGNCLLDSWFCQHHPNHSKSYDPSGAWAASGKVHDGLLRRMLEDAYFSKRPPKSTGREYFNMAWLKSHLQALPDNPPAADVQATLSQLTATSLAAAIIDTMPDVRDVPICGGGRGNDHLMRNVQAALNPREQADVRVMPCEAWGFDGDAIEAAAFAWLAYRRVAALKGNQPDVTGAMGERVLGALYPG